METTLFSGGFGPTTLFGGGCIPAVHFRPVKAIHFGEFQPSPLFGGEAVAVPLFGGAGGGSTARTAPAPRLDVVG